MSTSVTAGGPFLFFIYFFNPFKKIKGPYYNFQEEKMIADHAKSAIILLVKKLPCLEVLVNVLLLLLPSATLRQRVTTQTISNLCI